MTAQFSIAATDLIAALAWLDKAAPMEKRRTIPILNCCLIRAGSDGRAMIEGFDCDSRPRADVAADVTTAGAVIVDRAQLLALAKRAKDSKADSVEIGAPDVAKVRLGFGTACYDFETRPLADWPGETVREIEQADSAPLLAIDYPAADLCEDLALLSPAVSTEETRYYLNGICFDVAAGTLSLAATNGHILAVIRRFVSVAADDMAPIIPRVPVAALAYLAKAGGSVRIELFREGGRAIAGAYSFGFKLIDGTFPQWQRIEGRFDAFLPSLDIESGELSAHIKTAVKRDKAQFWVVEAGADAIRAGQTGEGAHARPLTAGYDGAAIRLGVNAAYLVPYAKTADRLRIQAPEMETGADYVESPMSVIDPARPHFGLTLMPMRAKAALPAPAAVTYPNIQPAPGRAADLFDVETFDGSSTKPRKATDDECRAYLMDYARRCGLAEFEAAETIYANGELLSGPRGLLIGGNDVTALEYVEGAYCVPMPGKIQAPVTVQTIRDDGTLSDPIVCTDAKGSIALPDQPKEKRRRKAAATKPAIPADTAPVMPDPAVIECTADAIEPASIHTPPLEGIEPLPADIAADIAPADSAGDGLADLAARVAALEARLAAMDSAGGETAAIDSPPLAEIEPLPVYAGARALHAGKAPDAAIKLRAARVRAAKAYLALRAKRKEAAAVMAENAALLVRLADAEKARSIAVAKRQRTIGAAWRRNKAGQAIARQLNQTGQAFADYKARAAAQYEKANGEAATAKRLLGKARADLALMAAERDRQAVAIAAITARVERMETGQGRAAA